MLRRSLDTPRSNGCKSNNACRNGIPADRNPRTKQALSLRFTDGSGSNRSDDDENSSLISRCSALRLCATVKMDFGSVPERMIDSDEHESEAGVDCESDGDNELTRFLRDCDSAPPRSHSPSHSQSPSQLQSQVSLPAFMHRERTVCTQRGLLSATEALKKNRRKCVIPLNTRLRTKVVAGTSVARSRSCTLNMTDISPMRTPTDASSASSSTSSSSVLNSPQCTISQHSMSQTHTHTHSHMNTNTNTHSAQSPLRRSVGAHRECVDGDVADSEGESEGDPLSHSTSSFPIISGESKRTFGNKGDSDIAGTSPVMASPMGSPMVAFNHGPFRHTLVLDIDETLVHCAHEKIDDADLFFEVSIDGKVFPIYCLLRPHLYEFLDTVSKLFNVVAFTASLRDYADQLLDRIDPQARYFRARYFRESCGENYCKNLLAVQNDLTTICIVDNMAQAYGLQPANGIDITSWYSDRSDTALRELIPFLATLTFFPDVRVPIRQRQMQQLKIAGNAGTGNAFYTNSYTTSTLSVRRQYQIDTASSSLIASARQVEVVEVDDTQHREDDLDLLMDEADSGEYVL